MICRHALQRLAGYSNDAWKTVVRFSLLNEVPTHGLMGKASNRTLAHFPCILLAEFFDTVKGLAAPRATQLVRNMVREHDTPVGLNKLRDDNPDLIELPPSVSKASLFQRFLHEHGWKPVYDPKH